MKTLPSLHKCTVAIIGLGYVGLPLAVEFAKSNSCCRTGAVLDRRIIGFDINRQRLNELRAGIDLTQEICPEDLKFLELIHLTDDSSTLVEADVFIVTVPTPIDDANIPNLTPLIKASSTVAQAISKNKSSNIPLVIYESTVFPGATEEVCVPIIERGSALKFNEDFCCGYSPERINPGDNENKLRTIVKVTSGSTAHSAEWIDNFYGSIIDAGTHLAPSIKVAEAAKVIENTQRDLNIALVNELAIIFKHMDIDTSDVLEAASTKWNFLQFSPGLVGGHCIGVDPYYLTYKAEQLGFHPQLVLAGRRINNNMHKWIVEQIVIEMAKQGIRSVGSKALVLGYTFKENCPDTRNSKVVDMARFLSEFGIDISIYDPYLNPSDPQVPPNFNLLDSLHLDQQYDVIVAAVKHREFLQLTVDEWKSMLSEHCVIFDAKDIIPREIHAIRL